MMKEKTYCTSEEEEFENDDIEEVGDSDDDEQEDHPMRIEQPDQLQDFRPF